MDTRYQRKGPVRALIALALATLATSVSAATIHVPADYSTIGEAIAAASTGDSVLVAPDTYSGPGNVGINFGGKDLVVLGTGGAAQTIIDGTGTAAYGWRFDNGETVACEVRDFTFQGFANDSWDLCALCCDGASPTFRDLWLCDNGWSVGPDSWSSAMFLANGAAPVITDCEFRGNFNSNGGALSCMIGAHPVLTNVTFIENRGMRGAAVYIRGDCAAEFHACRFLDNLAESHWLNDSDHSPGQGAVYCRDATGVLFEDCLFAGNHAEYDPPFEPWDPYGNPGLGGALHARNSTLTLRRCTLHGNSAETFEGTAKGGGLYCGLGCSVTLEQTIVASAIEGGGVYVLDPAAIVTLTCCDIWNNTDGNYLGQISDQTGINGNISECPRFCDAQTGDYTLAPNSACLPANNDCGLQIGAFGQGCDTPIYLIAGVIRGALGDLVGGIEIQGAPWPLATNVEGEYILTVAAGWSGTLTPVSSYLTFEPPSRSYAGLAADQLDQDFLAISDVLKEVPTEYATIQLAIDQSLSGDTILVAPGTYTGTGNQDIELRGIDLVVLGAGGAAQTIIDCQSSGRAFHIHAGETNAALVQGFTIRNGHIDYPVSEGDPAGGGVKTDGASPTMRDLRIENCIAYDTIRCFGGGIYCGEGQPVLADIVVTGCESQYGAGMYFRYCDATVSGVAVFDNQALAWGHGTGIGIEGSTVSLTQATIVANGGGSDGAIYMRGGGNTDIDNSLIAYAVSSGGIYLADDGTTATVTCCDVYGNAGGDYLGALPDQTGINGNISADPLFCDPAAGDFTVATGSPCLPENNDCGVQMGAYGEGCSGGTAAPEEAPPAVVTLAANHPNPFNPETAIRFGLPADAAVDLEIFDVAGRRVATLLVGEALPAGWHTVTWRGRDDAGRALASGVYLYRLRAGGQVRVNKMTLLK